MEINGISSITVHNNKFYAGQTKEDAMSKGIYERTWRRDFTNIDINDDGILSVNEVLKERKRENKENKIDLVAGTALFGIPDIIMLGLPALAIWGTAALGLMLYINNYSNNNKKIINYIKENNINVNEPNKLSVKA